MDLFRSDLLKTGRACESGEAKGIAIEWGADPFALRVVDVATQRALFNTSATRLIFKDHYMEVTT